MRRCKVKRGFTLVETLVVVGMLVILMGIAIPAVAVTQSSLKMQELDDSARHIFLAVQNRLTTMKASGELYRFGKKMSEDMFGQMMSAPLDKPQDYGDADADWMSLYYLNSEQDMAQDFLLADSDILAASLRTGKFMVELNPRSGDVYSVFYVEDGTISRTQVTDLPDRTRESRRKTAPKLGYYGGNAELSASTEFPDKFSPILTLVNAEDLYLKIDCSGLRKLVATQSKLNITIKITDESYKEEVPNTGVWTKKLENGADYRIDALGTISYLLVLDSLRLNENFEAITQGKLNPGDNIKITVIMEYSDGGTSITGEAVVNGNSLFESKASTETPVPTLAINVGRLRHLNNLRDSIYKSSATDIEHSTKLITQTRTIDFNPENWDGTALVKDMDAPVIPFFEKIDNKNIFADHTDACQPTYRGNGNELRNFVFASSGTEGVGLFGKIDSAKKVTLTGIRFVDCSVDGNYSNVGLLVAESDGIIDIVDCRAYLSTKDEDGRFILTDEMIEAHGINAGNGSFVGGLVGKANGSVNFQGCFVAIPVNGKTQVGGLAGKMANGFIRESYGSGDITATEGDAGGLVGAMGSGTVENAYSTANVTTPHYGGGIVGRVTTGGKPTFKNVVCYGDVKVEAGKWNMSDSGPTVGHYPSVISIGDAFENCKYFSQSDYNQYTGISGKYGTPTSLIDLLTLEPNPSNLSFPYMARMDGHVFPFPLISYSSGGSESVILPHYGNWPMELRLQTSLVYYEKYEDQSYGYYAVTSLTTNGDDTGGETTEDTDKEEHLNKWSVDTLKDEVCIEDGYALMTIYPLTSFSYSMEGGAKKTVEIVEQESESGIGKSFKMASGISLDFKKDVLTCRISNAEVYQLPFELQIVERMKGNVPSFYTKLTLDGFSKKDDAVSDPIQVIKDFTFFYCPDFAKNAVNPDPDVSLEAGYYPKNPGGEEKPIYVRSARQLNGLGHSYYYWNIGNNSLRERFYFVQQTDIDFGTYTKRYCGVKFDLMNTQLDNPYRNKPIGRPGNQNGASFQNVYDGGSHRIIDYCLETYPDPKDTTGNYVIANNGYQYTGMFGEIQYAILKNIVMVASDPGQADEASSGYVKSHYNPGSNPGTGALAGLVYVQGGSDNDSERAKIINCAISGYDVSYTATKVPSDGSSGNRGYGVVGGMVGFNYGLIENCTAAMKQVSFLQTGGDNPIIARNIGGLVGSMNDKSRVTNCYTSGTLVGDNGAGALVYGGISGGYQIQSSERTDARKIINSYSICVWDPKVQVNVKKGATAADKKWGPVCPTGNNITMENCYYLGDVVDESITFPTVAGVTAKTYDELSGVIDLTEFGPAVVTYPWKGYAQNHYPFPSIIKDESGTGQFVHHGGWGGTAPQKPSAFVVYYEKYKLRATGKSEWRYTYLRSSGTLTTNLPKNEGTIEESGYGVLVANPWELPNITGIDESGYKSVPADADKISLSYGIYALRPFSDEAMVKLSEGEKTKELNMTFTTTDGTTGAVMPETLSFCLYVRYAGAISAAGLSRDASLGGIENPFAIRTLSQLRNMTADEAALGSHFQIRESIQAGELERSLKTEDFIIDGGYESGGKRIRVDGYAGEVGSNGCYIFGLRRPLFETITERTIVENLALLDVQIHMTKNDTTVAASITPYNYGTISGCIVTGELKSESGMGAAGLVWNNTGTIKESYFSGSVIGPLRYDLAGVEQRDDVSTMVIDNKGTIDNCYATGMASGNRTSGVANINSGKISNTYVLVDVTKGLARYAFAESNKAVANCYWAQNMDKPIWNNNPGFNSGEIAGVTKKNLSELSVVKMGDLWSIKEEVSGTYPATDACKDRGFGYPKLKKLDHYGDWPIPPKK